MVYEYKQISTYKGDWFSLLPALGMEGWRLVCSVKDAAGETSSLVFIRRKPLPKQLLKEEKK
jgi:hypothetical protein